jgi:hypothetical protein
MQLEGAKCKMSRGPTGAKGRLNRALAGRPRSAGLAIFEAVRPPFLEPEEDATLCMCVDGIYSC